MRSLETSAAPSEIPSEPALTDWVQRALSKVGLVWMFLLLFAGFMAVTVLFKMTFLDFGAIFDGPIIWIDAVNAALFAYIPAASRLLRQGRLRDLRDLRCLLACDAAEFALLQEQTVSVAPRRLAAGGIIGAIVRGAAPILDPAWFGQPLSLVPPGVIIFFVLRNAALGWLLGHTVLSELAATRAFFSIGREHARVDLFDVTPLAPFARAGARSAVTWMLTSWLVSLFWLGPAGAETGNGPIVAVILVTVLMEFFFSVAGLRQSIRRAKRDALDALVAQIRQTGTLLATGQPAGDGPVLADLVSLQTLIEHVPEWPMGGPTVLRGILVAALAAGSWLGGALVERLLEAVLG